VRLRSKAVQLFCRAVMSRHCLYCIARRQQVKALSSCFHVHLRVLTSSSAAVAAMFGTALQCGAELV
jgi:hypothetical protein